MFVLCSFVLLFEFFLMLKIFSLPDFAQLFSDSLFWVLSNDYDASLKSPLLADRAPNLRASPTFERRHRHSMMTERICPSCILHTPPYLLLAQRMVSMNFEYILHIFPWLTKLVRIEERCCC